MKRYFPISKPISILVLTIGALALVGVLMALVATNTRQTMLHLQNETQLVLEYEIALGQTLGLVREGTLFSEDPSVRSQSQEELTAQGHMRQQLLAVMEPELAAQFRALEGFLALTLERMRLEDASEVPVFPEREFQDNRGKCFTGVQHYLGTQLGRQASRQWMMALVLAVCACLLVIVGCALTLYIRHAYQQPVHAMIQALEERAQISTDCLDPSLGSLAQSVSQLIGRYQDTRQARFIVDSMTEGLLIISPQGRVLSANKSILEMLGYDETDLVGRPFTDVYVKVKSVHVQGFFKRNDTYKEEELFKTADGKVIPVRFSSSFLFDQDMEVLGFVCIAKDITKEKKVEEELQKQSDWFKITLASIADAVITTDTEGRVNFCNQAARQLLALEDDPDQKPLEHLFHPLDPATHHPHAIETAIAKGEPIQRELLLRQQDGRELTIDLIQAPIRSSQGLFHGTVFVLHDITQVRLAAIELLEAKEKAEAALELKSRFLAIMSHEIRTPMGGVLGMVEQLLHTDLNATQRQITEIIHASGDSLLHLLNDILDFSKVEAGKLVLETMPFSLETLVGEVTGLLSQKASAKGLGLHTQIDPALPAVLCGDPTRIRQILLNLVSNAIKFTAHGQVTLSVELEQRQGEWLTLTWHVRDTGIGIDSEAMTRLFEAFTQASADITRKFGGTGLGLTICKQLAEAMHGRIWASSQPGEGSTFSFSLPLREAATQDGTRPAGPAQDGPRPTTPASAPALAADPSAYRILVAEDNPVNQRIAANILDQLGFACRIVEDGRATMAALDEEAFDLVILDCHMPVLDGFETTRAIRALGDDRNQLPIVAVTARALEGDREACIAAGMDDYLTKPLRRPDLMACLSRLLLERPPKEASRIQATEA